MHFRKTNNFHSYHWLQNKESRFVSWYPLSLQQDLEQFEMVFSEGKVGSGGDGGLMKPATTRGSEFGLLSEPSVVLHAMNSSEWVPL